MQARELIDWLVLHSQWLYFAFTMGLLLTGISLTGRSIRQRRRPQKQHRWP